MELIDYLNKQLHDEIGVDAFGEENVLTNKEVRMLLQKHGIMTPQLTNTERNLIRREELQHGR